MLSPFFAANFVNSSGSAESLSGYAPLIGAGAFVTQSGTGFEIIANGGRIRNGGTGQSFGYFSASNGTGSSQTVAFDITIESNMTHEWMSVSLGCTTSNVYGSGYILRYEVYNGAGGFHFKDQVTGNSPSGGSGSTDINVNLAVGNTYHIEFTVTPTLVSFSINGSYQMSYTPAANANTPSNGVGFEGNTNGTTPSDATGIQISNVYAYSTSATQNTIAPDDSHALLSPGNQHIVAGTSLEWIFPGTSTRIATPGTALGIYVSTANCANLGSTSLYPSLEYSLDGGPWQLVSPTSTGLIPFTTGANVYGHYAEVRLVPNGTDNESSTYGSSGVSPYSSLLITGYWTDYGATGGLTSLTGNSAGPANLAMADGDSIFHGYDVNSNLGTGATTALFAMPMMIGHGLNATMGIKAHSGQGVIKTASNGAPNLQTTISKADFANARVVPAGVKYWIIGEGVNDTSTTTTSAQLAAGVQAVLSTARSMANAAGATNCILVWVAPIATTFTNDSPTPIAAQAGTLAGVNAYKSASSDTRVLHVDPTALNLNIVPGKTGQYNNATSDVHPGTEATMMVAAYVVGQIKAFEQSLSSTGPTALRTRAL